MNMMPLGDSYIIEELWYLPMGDHTPVYNRPYTVNADKEAIDILVDRKLETGNSTIDGSILRDLTSRFVTPNASVEHSLIDANWVSQPRFVFMMKVRSSDAQGIETYSYIQGFTNYNGISNQGNADMEMIHQVNTIIETYIMNLPTPLGLTRKEKLTNIYNVFMHNNSEFYTQRPTDVMGNMKLFGVVDSFEGSNIQIQGAEVLGGTVNRFNNNAPTSKVSNQVATEYLSTILNASMSEATSKDILLGSYEYSDNSVMGTRIIEASLGDNRFMKYLSSLDGWMTVKGEFSFGQLMRLDSTIHDRFTLINLSKNYQDPNLLNTPTVGEYWHGSDPVTIKAYSLIESSVSLATGSGFNKLFFTATNMNDPTGAIEIFITNFASYTSLDNMDLSVLLDRFKNKLTLDVLIPETSGGTLPFYMEMYVDLLGTSKINLEYAGFPAAWYTIPTTANSMFSSIMTFDKNSLDATTLNFQYLTDTLLATQSENTRMYYR